MKMISLLLALVFSMSSMAQRTQTLDADYVRIRDGVAVDKFEFGYIDGLTSNAQTQITARELLSNKATSLASPDNTKYPTTQAVATGLSLKENNISAGTTAQYWRGDKSWQTLDTSIVPENGVLYFTLPRVRATDLAGLSTATATAITSSDTILSGMGKLQGQVTANGAAIATKQDIITGAASTITSSNLALSKALVSDGSGKVAASTVTSTELGYVSGVTSSIQTQINTNSSNIATNTSSITTNDGLAVHKAGTETITGDKLFTGQLTATSTTKGNRPCPVMTTTQRDAIASPANGDCVYNSSTSALNIYDSATTSWKTAGGGAGAGSRLELMTDSSFESVTTDGTCSGCVASLESTTVMITASNTKSLKMAFTASAGSYTVDKATGSQFLGADATVGAWIKTDQLGCYFKSRVNGADTGDSKSVTNDSGWHFYELIVTAGSTSIGYKIDCTTSITGNVYADESSVKVSSRVATLAYTSTDSDWAACTFSTLAWGGFGNVTATGMRCRRQGSDLLLSGYFTTGTVGSSSATIQLPTWGGVQLSTRPENYYGGRLLRNTASSSNVKDYDAFSTAQQTFLWVSFPELSSAQSPLSATTGSGGFSSGEIISVEVRVPINGWSATNPNYLTAPETFSTDYTPLVYAGSGTYTLSTLANAPVGTFITFTTAINTNTHTQTTTAPTQTTADMATNGIQITARPWNASSTAALPAKIAIQIGKNLKGVKADLYTGSGKTLGSSADYSVIASTVERGALTFYEEKTGIFQIDAASVSSVNTTLHQLDMIYGANPGWFVINASKNPALTGLNVGFVGASYEASNGQSIPQATYTVMTGWTKIIDSHNAMNTSTGAYTIPVSGVYEFTARILYSGSTLWNQGEASVLKLRIGGVDSKASTHYVEANDPVTHYNDPGTLTYTQRMTAGQIVDFVAYQESGAALSIITNPIYNQISIKKVAE